MTHNNRTENLLHTEGAEAFNDNSSSLAPEVSHTLPPRKCATNHAFEDTAVAVPGVTAPAAAQDISTLNNKKDTLTRLQLTSLNTIDICQTSHNSV